MRYCRRVIDKQRVKVLGLCDTPNSSYSAKGTTQNHTVLSSCCSLRDINIAVGSRSLLIGSCRKLVGHLEFTLALSKHLFSLLKLKTVAWGLERSELENTRRIVIFVYVSCLTALFSKQRMLPR